MDINSVSYEKVKSAYARLNYRFYTGDKHINICGIRDESNVDSFNDCIAVAYVDSGTYVCRTFTATTDPGKYYLLNPLSSKGTAILVPGNYPDAFRIGMHQGKYKALVQNKPLPVYRDRTKTGVLHFNPSSIETGMFGINLHRASANTVVTHVGKYSAGCQVVLYASALNTILSLAEQSGKKYGYKTFNYTLFTQEQFNGR